MTMKGRGYRLVLRLDKEYEQTMALPLLLSAPHRSLCENINGQNWLFDETDKFT